MTVPGLQDLARLHGIQTAYYDNDKNRVTASPEALMAALGSLGVEARDGSSTRRALAHRRRAEAEKALEPVIVVWLPDDAPAFNLTVPAGTDAPIHVTVELEEGGQRTARRASGDLEIRNEVQADGRSFHTVRVPLPSVPAGYHRLQVEIRTAFPRTHEALLLAAPRKAAGWETLPGGPAWGVFAPLWSLWTAEGPNRIPHFGLLADLAEPVAALGGSVVGTLPVLAAFLDEPYEPSPYAPVSRLFWNELYVDAGGGHVVGRSFHRRVAMGSRRQALEDQARSYFRDHPSSDGPPPELASFAARRPWAADYGRFRALTEALGPWPGWPDRLRARDVRPGDYDESVARYHLYAQWRAEEELARTEERAAARGCSLYLDLPLGVDPRGYDVWRFREHFILDATAGAPPDPLAPEGQDWGFHPLHPEQSRLDGHRYFIDAIRTHLRFARVLRVDHVMQLHRLFIRPEGSPEGVYLRYPYAELYAILCLESHRAGSVVVGEDLGTVPVAVRKGLRRHGIPGTYVVQFELRDTQREGKPALVPRQVPTGALAGINTHDTPTFAAWWTGRDAEIRRERGLLGDQEARDAVAGRRDLREKLARGVGVEPAEEDDLLALGGARDRTLEALFRTLGASRAGLALAALDDLWLETEPQNVPGTPAEDNWNGRATGPVEAVEEGRPGQLLSALNEAREGTA